MTDNEFKKTRISSLKQYREKTKDIENYSLSFDTGSGGYYKVMYHIAGDNIIGIREKNKILHTFSVPHKKELELIVSFNCSGIKTTKALLYIPE